MNEIELEIDIQHHDLQIEKMIVEINGKINSQNLLIVFVFVG